MDEYLIAVILGIIEGRYRVPADLIDRAPDPCKQVPWFHSDFAATFDVFIQMGAILVCGYLFQGEAVSFWGKEHLG